MNLYQIAKNIGNDIAEYVTGPLSYMEAMKKVNEFNRNNTDEGVTYTVEFWMPVRRNGK